MPVTFKLGLTNPAQPGEITQAGMLVCISPNYGVGYTIASKPDTSTLASGFRQVGVLAEVPNIEVGRATEPVKTGIYGITQELLFKDLTGRLSCQMYGVDPYFMSVGLGVDPIVTTGSGTTASGAGTVDTGSGNTAITVAAATGLSVGQTVQVCPTANKSTSTNFAKIASIDDTDIVLDRLLRTPAASGDAVTPVTSVELPIGGTAPKYFSFAGITDFPDGRVALIQFPKVYSAKSLSFGFGSGQEAVKVPLELEAVAVLDSTHGVIIGRICIWP